MLDLLKIQGLGPKTIALIWSAYQVSDVDGVARLAKEGKIRELPRMGEKQEQKLLKAIEDYRRIAGRFLLDAAEQQADKIIEHLRDYPGVEKVTPAGSLRRGRETVGDLDILVTGKSCCYDGARQDLIDHIIKLPGLMEIIARGDNKISFRLRGGMQVDVRLLPPDSFGAAMQYFTGSKAHNVALRQRALKMGYTLSEYSLARTRHRKTGRGKDRGRDLRQAEDASTSVSRTATVPSARSVTSQQPSSVGATSSGLPTSSAALSSGPVTEPRPRARRGPSPRARWPAA